MLWRGHATQTPHVVVSDASAKAVKELVGQAIDEGGENGQAPVALRMGVAGGQGCHGFAYTFELTHDINDDDEVFEKDGAKVVVDAVSLSCLGKGSVLEHINTIRKKGFEVLNNNLADSECGCKVSFALKDEALL
ncbi:HesB/YadR/YfhF [Thecamonas trahens ATCC 50062]|uniref:HesB/YadR/YfhF n=1 Tax=Thecamonas trahens ATCC 50062 TaxID=461836 RepID=A0A0L0DJN1_THETB|nr:HesB/YadR/YfhF [Thecamonas trahens ATCC 50062]KNC52316.1 HesB/YadR/YfhF [Thecamonas trahens ATCC 50062]|eukprot:XP_013762312.1 HesB/YadR/YfhF [Thecamonas trahens ATCC 50062]